MSEYVNLADEAKIEEAIKFIAIGQPLPKVYEDFLKKENLYSILIKPGGKDVVTQSDADDLVGAG